jgi:short-subunit dehydrogenase
MKVQNKVIVVTGAGNGMGREVALNLLSKGASVAAVDINEATLQETQDLAGNKKDKISLHVVNITNLYAVNALPEQVISKHGVVDGVINNAGIIQPFVRVNDLSYDAIQRVFNVNFFGTLYVTKSFLPYLLERPEAHILNISSMGGFLPVPGQTIYGASKAAVKLLTEGLNAELIDTKVEVTVVFPGAIGTNIAANSGIANMTMENAENNKRSIQPLDPKDAAEIIVKGMEKNQYSVFVGKDSKMLDLFYRISPRRAAGLISRQMKSLLS